MLIVDDDQMDQELVATYLAEGGYRCEFAGNGSMAIAKIKASPPDVVLTDMKMPELDGLGLVDHIRREHPSIPVVLMTGYGTGDTAVKALKTGAASYIPKSKLKDSVTETVASVLRTRDAVASMNKDWNFLSYRESHYVVGYEEHARSAIINRFEAELGEMNFCDESERIRVATALTESLANAIEHGNLELDSELKEEEFDDYYELGRQRAKEHPYSSRRVRVISRVTPSQIEYIVSDDGRGFDYTNLPDPKDPENFAKLSGRGLLLIRTFMDEVRFNESGNEITMVKRRTA